MITTAIYFGVVWFSFTEVYPESQPQVMSPRVFSSRLRLLVKDDGFLFFGCSVVNRSP